MTIFLFGMFMFALGFAVGHLDGRTAEILDSIPDDAEGVEP